MTGRGRRATFPDLPVEDAASDLATIAQMPDPRRFRVRVDGGDDLMVDLSSWSHPAFTAAIAPYLQEFVRRMGPTPIRRTIHCRVLSRTF